MDLNDPLAKRLLADLRRALATARKTLRPGEPIQVPADVTGLPALIERLQTYLPPRKREPVPFWRCVRKLNKEKPSLELTKTLEDLFNRAAKLTPGPLTRLMNNTVTPSLTETEKRLAEKLAIHLENKPNKPPNELHQYRQLFDRTASNLGAVLSKRSSRLDLKDDNEFLSSLGFLDFYWQHRSWRDQYEQAIGHLYDIAVVLEHQPFVDKIKPLLFGDYLDVPKWLQSRKKFLARRRQQRWRSKPGKPAPPSRQATKRRARSAQTHRRAVSRSRRKKRSRKA